MSFLLDTTKRVERDIIFNPTTPNEIISLVNKMANKKSCGFDDVPISILKENIEVLAFPLSEFFNKCMEESIFPDQLKMAKVIPIYKKGSKTNPKNYRPISLLPALSKLFENIIKSRLMTHLRINKIINPRQYGYQKGIGTIDAISTFINDIVGKLNEKMKVAGLFVDLSSAFDTIDHELLITKLEHYGIRGRSLQLMSSYLQNRRMSVEIKNIDDNSHEVTYNSKIAIVKRGVPQGSILGPILYIIFTNDLLNYMNKTQPNDNLVVFADDTNIIIGAKDIEELTVKTVIILKQIREWFTANNLLLNTSKTSLILFKTISRNNEKLNIQINGEKIELVDKVKFLGVNIDSHLNWKSELAEIESSLSSSCYALRSLRDELGIEQLKAVYYALIDSKIRYSVMLWGNSYSYNWQRAFILQKRAIRIMVRVSQSVSCRNYFKELGILTVPSLYILVTLSHFVKNLHEFESQDEREVRERTRRKTFKQQIAPKFNIVKHCSKYQAVEIFNKLPSNLKTLIYNSHLFKAKLKAFLLDKCPYTIAEINETS